MNFYSISAIVFASIFLIGILFYTYKIHFWKYARRKQKLLPSAEQNKKYAILIPARDESKVIRGLLESIKSQTYNQENLLTYVIVSDDNDPTIKICEDYKNTTCYVLPKEIRPNIKSKGATLQAMIKKLWADGERFDGYFIIDADNVMKPDFVEHMHNGLCVGNDLVLGGRLNKTPSGNWVNCGSSLTWTYINTMNNKCRSENGQNIVVQGSPLLVSKTIIEDFWQGDWPLTSLTEDYEMGFICSIHDFKTFYYEYALCYDEQPTTYLQSSKQRIRWIKGHNSVDAKYSIDFHKHPCKFNRGIYKFDTLCALVGPIIIIASALLFALYSLVATIVLASLSNPLWVWTLVGTIGTFAGFYLLLSFWAMFAMIVDAEKLNLSAAQSIEAFFTVPLFFMSWLPIFIKSFFIKDVKWAKIEHNQKVEK